MLEILPNQTTGPLVVALGYDGPCTFEFAIAAEIFGLARPEMGSGWYRFASAAIEPGLLRAHGGLKVQIDGALELLDLADIIIVPGWKGPKVPVPENLSDRLVAASSRGARIASICSGAFVLAATGLLNGRRAATHWRYADELRHAHPDIEVDAEVLYVDDERLLTSAGSAAGIDLMLYIVRSDFGAAAANSVARRLVVSPHRNGGQAQFVERPVPSHRQTGLSPLFDQIRADPTLDWTVPVMAHRALMSERTFVRRFLDATGQSPCEWLVSIRVAQARRLLEASQIPLEKVARLAGFGSISALRLHLRRDAGLSPSEYRERFNGAQSRTRL